MLSLRDLLTSLTNFQLATQQDPTDVRIQTVTADSRRVDAGALFVAIQGHQMDGHRFIPAAVAQGAAAILGTRSLADLAAHGITFPAHLPYIQADDSREALAHCCSALYAHPSRAMTVIGVTGTDGKTTTCSLLESILAVATREPTNDVGRVGVITTVGARIRGVESDTGFHVTTPDAPDVQRFLAQMRAADCRYAILESTSHGLAQSRVAAVDFDVAAVTNITHEHLDEHGTREAYVAAKAKLFRMLYHAPLKPAVTRCAVLNADDEGSFDALRQVLAEEAAQSTLPVSVRRYGLADQATAHPSPPDVTAVNIVYAPDRTRFILRWWEGEFGVESQLIGEFNVANVLASATVALALGLAPTVVQEGIARFAGVLGRMERIDRGQPFLALVDFAHTPVSLERALLTLRPLVGQRETGETGRLIAVFGSAGLRDRAKRYLMGQVSGRLADFTVITAEDPRTEDVNDINAEIARGVRAGGSAAQFTIVPDRSEAIQFAVDMAQSGDVVAAFGKGHERSMCYGEIEYPWSDQDALAQALERRIGNGNA